MEWLGQDFLGNAYGEWLIALSAWVVTVIVLRTLQIVARHRLAALAAKTDTRWDDNLMQMIAKTRLSFLLVVGLFAGSFTLELGSSLNSVLQTLVVIALLLQAGLWGSVLVVGIIERHRKQAEKENPAAITTINVIGFVARIALWSTVVLLILDNLGIDVTALVAGLGIGGVAIALAVQRILGDLFASLSIVLDKPFVVGDFLIVDDLLGSVEHVGLKTTRLRSLSGEQLVFSNSDLLNSRIRNYGRMYERRVVFTLGVTYETPRDTLLQIPGMIREAVEAQERTRFDRSHFMQYGDYSLNFETVYYVLSRDYNVHMDIQQAIYFRIHERFEEAGIEFAYPTQKLYLAGNQRSPMLPRQGAAE
jgi:small-conductance mechanosensitive channel